MDRQWIGGWLVAAMLLLASSAHADPVQWKVEDGGNGHYYDLVFEDQPLSWTQARDAAAASMFLGSTGHLATITSAAENAFVRDTFAGQLKVQKFRTADDKDGDFAWIGLTDVASEGVYEWVTGEAFAFADWGPFEPNNLGDQDYILVRVLDDGRIPTGPTFQWDTNFLLPTFGVDRIGYVVEYEGPFKSVAEPVALLLIVIALSAVHLTRVR